MLLCLHGQSRVEAMYRSAWPTYCAARWSSQSSWPKVDYRTPQQQRRRVRGGPREGWREGYTKRARHRGRKRRKKRWCSLLFSFVSLESFPLPPLEETAAPTTQTSINRTSLWKVSLISSFVQLQCVFSAWKTLYSGLPMNDFCICVFFSCHWLGKGHILSSVLSLSYLY